MGFSRLYSPHTIDTLYNDMRSGQMRGRDVKMDRSVSLWQRGRECCWRNIAVIISSTLSFIVYANTLGAGFVYDDSRAIQTNEDIFPSSPWSNIFYNDFWGIPLTHSGSHKSYRPVCVLSFRLNYLVHGFKPWGYHLVNVLLHSTCTALFAFTCQNLFKTKFPVIVASLFFALHPIHTEAVAGVVGRADLGAAIFFLCAFCCFQRQLTYAAWHNSPPTHIHRHESEWKRRLLLILTVLFGFLAMITKEHGLTVLGVCGAYEVFIIRKVHPLHFLLRFYKKTFSRAMKESVLVLLFGALSLLAFRMYMLGASLPEFATADNPASHSDSLFTRTMTFLYLPVFNFLLCLYPKWLSFDWSMNAIPLVERIFDKRNFLTVCFYSILLFVIRKCSSHLMQFPRHLCCAASEDSLYSRVALYLPKGVSCITDNNNYTPYTMGKIRHRKQTYQLGGGKNCQVSTPNNWDQLCCEVGGSPILRCQPLEQSELTMLSLTILILPFLPATNLFFYVGFVVAERVLYLPTIGYCMLIGVGVQHFKNKMKGLYRILFWIMLSITLISHSCRTVLRNWDWYDEESLYLSGIAVNPPKAYGNLGNILSSQGKNEAAKWAYREALKHRVNMADVHYNLGLLLHNEGHLEEAIASYQSAIQFRPSLALGYLNLGQLYIQLGQHVNAENILLKGSNLDGSGLKDPKTHEIARITSMFHLGRLFVDQGRLEEAIDIFLKAIREMPVYYQPQSLYNILGEAYSKLGHYHQAEQWYKAALQVKPDHVPAHLTYGKMLSKNKTRLIEAEQWFLKAKELAPNDSAVHQHFGQFLAESGRHEEAVDYYLRAADLAPRDPNVVFNAANALREAGQKEEAEKFYRMAVSLQPEDASSHMNLGAMLHLNGKLSEAEHSYLKALKLRPNDPTTLANLQKLYNLYSKHGIQYQPHISGLGQNLMSGSRS